MRYIVRRGYIRDEEDERWMEDFIKKTKDTVKNVRDAVEQFAKAYLIKDASFKGDTAYDIYHVFVLKTKNPHKISFVTFHEWLEIFLDGTCPVIREYNSDLRTEFNKVYSNYKLINIDELLQMKMELIL